MATQITFSESFTAGADLRWGEFVKLSASGEVVPCDAAGEAFVGVVSGGSYDQGETALIAMALEVYVLCQDPDVEPGTLIKTDANGEAAVADGSNDFTALALDHGRAAGDAGEVAKIRAALPIVAAESDQT